MIRAVVIYHSLYGNTKVIAKRLTDGLKDGGIESICESIDDIDINSIQDFDFIAIGCPTHMLSVSKQMKKFLLKLDDLNLEGKKGFCFDTRYRGILNSRIWLFLENSASRRIERKLKSLKVQIITKRRSAIVKGSRGPLKANTEKTFRELGKKIANSL